MRGCTTVGSFKKQRGRRAAVMNIYLRKCFKHLRGMSSQLVSHLPKFHFIKRTLFEREKEKQTTYFASATADSVNRAYVRFRVRALRNDTRQSRHSRESLT